MEEWIYQNSISKVTIFAKSGYSCKISGYVVTKILMNHKATWFWRALVLTVIVILSIMAYT